jgi:leucyl aminopeptidase
MATVERAALPVLRASTTVVRGATLGALAAAGEVLGSLPGLPPGAAELLAQAAAEPGADAIGAVREVQLPGGQRAVLSGAGDAAPGSVRIAAARLARAAGAGTLSVVAGGALPELAEGLVLGAHSFSRKSIDPPARPRRIDIVLPDHDDAALAALEPVLRRAHVAGLAAGWARDLANEPSSTKNPAWLGAQAQRVLPDFGIAVAVRDEAWLAENGFGGVLAVGSGSATPPRLIEASWNPRRPRGAARGPHLVLVGKGITFDTGGLNIKHGDAMTMMHTDMSGGAAVLAAIRIVAARQLPIRVTALVPTAENAVSGSSMRPSDIIRHYGGRTTAVGNTDAEGRLVLADAIAYAADRLDPTVIVDIATLTGAMKVALGMSLGGLFATTDELAAALCAAGEATGEPLWRMPLAEEYRHLITSPVADADNAPGNPGGVTAALFLQPFAGDVPWAHLDIAGPARTPVDGDLAAKGATGFGARLLAEWVAGYL